MAHGDESFVSGILSVEDWSYAMAEWQDYHRVISLG